MVRELSSDQTKCVEEGFVKGLKFAEIAEQCGVHRNTVSRYYREWIARVGASQQPQQPQPQPQPQEGRATVEEDVREFMQLLESRLDPKTPIKAKWVSDVSWWLHLMLDFSKQMLPEALKMLSVNEIDVNNPEKTAKVAVDRFLTIIQDRSKFLDEISRLREEIKALELEKSRLEAEKRAYEKGLASLTAKIDELEGKVREIAGKVERTLKLIIGEVPKALPKEAREIYVSFVYPEVEKIWG